MDLRNRIGLVWVLFGASVLVTSCEQRRGLDLDEIEALINAGRTDHAISRLRPRLDRVPDDPRANLLLGLSWIRAGEPSLAIWPLENASRSPEVASEAGLYLAEILTSTGDARGALRALDRMTALTGQSDKADLLRAKALLLLGREGEALAIAESSDPSDETALAFAELRAIALTQLDRPLKARSAWALLEARAQEAGVEPIAIKACWQAAQIDLGEEAPQDAEARTMARVDGCLDRHPIEPAFLLWAAEVEIQRGRETAARRWLELGLEANPANLDLGMRLAQLSIAENRSEEAARLVESVSATARSAHDWGRIAEFHRAQGDLPNALIALRRAADPASSPSDLHFFALADLLIEMGELAEIARVRDEIEEPAMLALLDGALSLEKGDPKAALERLSAGLARWPSNAGARFLTGKAALALGDEDRAIDEFREALRSGPGTTEAALLLATLYEARDDEVAARRVLERDLTAREGTRGRVHAWVAHRAARYALSTQNVDTALALLERALAANPRDGAVANDLAWLLSEHPAQLDRALELSLAAVGEIRSAETLDTLARIHRRRGELDTALARYREALELDPEHPAIRNAIDEVLKEKRLAEPHQNAGGV